VNLGMTVENRRWIFLWELMEVAESEVVSTPRINMTSDLRLCLQHFSAFNHFMAASVVRCARRTTPNTTSERTDRKRL
jgi:hypothetical protein